VLLLRRSTHFGWRDVLLPIDSPVQPKLNTVGAAALYGLLIVIATSFFRLRMARPLWKKLHFLVFPAFALMFIHSMFTDPLLSNGRIDWLDGGKVFVASCFVIALTASAARLHLRRHGLRPRTSVNAAVGLAERPL
jgi:DMSO/TMAO reductase YedYZ heme-binding membrane subunit